MEMTFERIPQGLTDVLNKLEYIEQLILAQNNPSQTESERLFTIKEVAEFLHLTVPTIYLMVQRAEIPVCKRGKRLYFSKQEITSWIMAGRKKTTSEIEAKVNSYLHSSRKGRGK